jgi:hypothetical protein
MGVKVSIFRSNKGWAMPLALMIVMVAALLSAALFAYAMTDSLHVKQDTDREKARYLARSGAEAVIKAWLDKDITAKPTGAVERIYQLKDKTFKRDSELSAAQKTNDAVGYVDVTISNLSDGSTKFESIATVNGITRKAMATSSPYATGNGLGWYDYNTGYINTSPNPGNVQSVTIPRRGDYNISYHDPSGIVECKTSNNNATSLILRQNDAQNKVAYIAQSIFFYCPIDLNYNMALTDRIGALITSAQVLDFKKVITLRKGITSYGTLVLHVPETLGIKLKGKSGEYGKVYFEQDVKVQEVVYLWIIPIGIEERTVIDGPANYYFKRRVDASGKDIGFDILAWDEGEYALDDFIKMDSSDLNFATPNPKSKVWFVWDW